MEWKIKTLDRNADGGVVEAHWTVSKTSGDYTASAYGSVTFKPDSSSEDYIDYVNLTENDVIAWVRTYFDTEGVDSDMVSTTAQIEQTLDADLAGQASPSIQTGKPW